MSINILNADATNGQFLNHDVYKTVCSYLQDRETLALGTTCKKMQLVAKKELEERDQQLEQLLSSYALTRKFNIQTLKEAHLLAIGETHDDPQCRLDQSNLINLLTRRGFVLLVMEGWPSMLAFNDEDKEYLIKKTSWNLASKNNVYAIGWDDCTKIDALNEAINRKFEKEHTQHKQEREFIFQTAKKLLPKEMLPTEEEISELNRQNISCDHQLFTRIMQTIHIKIAPQLMELPLEVFENYALLKDLHDELDQSYYSIKTSEQHDRDAAIIETFPIRTLSMNNTLGRINDFLLGLGLPHAKVILIAGTSHLESINEECEKAGIDLTSFYEALSHHKAAVLIPRKDLLR